MSSKFDLFLELFPHCNLNCTFCHQRTIDGYADKYNSFVQMPKTYYVRQCLNQLKAQGITHCNHLNILGGELFYDKTKSYLDSMRELIEYLNPQVINATTNLIFNLDNNPLFDYISNRQEFILCASYNPVNRYTSDKQLQLFVNNVRKLYMPLYNKDTCICIEVVLQPEILLGQVEMPFLDYVWEANAVLGKTLIDVTFFLDYRGYPDNIVEHFNDYLYALVKRYPVFSNVNHLYEKSARSHKYGGCYKPGAKCLSYNNGFKYSGKNTACIDQSVDIYKMKDLLEKVYDCNNCPYDNDCMGRCPITFERAGLLKPNQYCYTRFLFDHYQELTQC